MSDRHCRCDRSCCLHIVGCKNKIPVMRGMMRGVMRGVMRGMMRGVYLRRL